VNTIAALKKISNRLEQKLNNIEDAMYGNNGEEKVEDLEDIYLRLSASSTEVTRELIYQERKKDGWNVSTMSPGVQQHVTNRPEFYAQLEEEYGHEL